jgi:hypothetical protein
MEYREGDLMPDFPPWSLSKRVAAARGTTPISDCQHPNNRDTILLRSRVGSTKYRVGTGAHVHTHYSCIILLCRAGCAHCVRLACAGLAVGKNGNIVTFHEGVYALIEIGVHAFLVYVRRKHAIKHKELLSLAGLDRQARRRRDVTCGAAESLGHEVVAGI